ncbi:MAG TPA: SpoIID/LytB domain-containing protein [Polyangia bacterium]|nr:SpoIID/LytB domain-containing protein [Polyangia bacterium]
MSVRALAALLIAGAASIAHGDELSGADKLRVVYSNQFAWTKDGLPLVTVRVAEGRAQVVIASPGARLLPDGDGGAEVRGGATWTVRVVNGAPAKIRWHVVVARLKPGDEKLPSTIAAWKERGFVARTFETGALFGVRGEVLDSRQLLVTVLPHNDEAGARSDAAALAAKFSADTSVHPELVERPRGTVEATDERGLSVKNDAILWFSPGPSGLLELDGVDKEGGGREKRRYFGKLYVTVDSGGKLAVVNAVPEDKLLAGLVPAEMMASSPPEALKAQAVAARNELLAKIGTRHLTDPYRLCATQHCQVYAGAGREDPRSTAAVTATRGELLERDAGGLVDAVYSASCGGHGEDNDRAWGGAPDASLRGALDTDDDTARALVRFDSIDEANLADWLAVVGGDKRPYCARPAGAAASWRWTRAIDLAAVAARAAVGPLTAVTVLERGVSGRAVALEIAGDRGKKQIRGELEIRRALGNLKSALFALDGKRDESGHLASLTALGAGHGHGLGMCQLGAVGLAEAGASYRDILLHYYKAAHLKKLY